MSNNLSISLMPDWPDSHRSMPNPLLRSSIFSVSDKRVRREYIEDTEIPVSGDFGHLKMTYQGAELRQDDADVLMQIFHLSRKKSIDQPVTFTRYQMVKDLGWSKNTESYDRLRSTLLRLTASVLAIIPTEDILPGRKGGFTGRLIDKFDWVDEYNLDDKVWQVWLDPKILFLFQSDKCSWIEWEPRLKMGGLEKWTQGYYASHLNPFPVKIETIMAACGTSNLNKNSFKRALKKAVSTLVELKQIQSVKFDDNLIKVKNNPKLKKINHKF